MQKYCAEFMYIKKICQRIKMLKEESVIQFIASHTGNGLYNYRRKFVSIILHENNATSSQF